MQTAALEALGLWGRVELRGDRRRARRVRGPDPGAAGEGFVGVNMTIPHKEAALALADEASEAARQIGAANTLSFADGAIRADNTDATGLIAALPGAGRGTHGARSRGGRIGSGRRLGSGRGRVRRSRSGTGPASERTSWSATSPAGAGGRGRLAPLSGEQARAGGFELIVNCTAIGMSDEDPFEHLPIDPERFGAGHRPGRSRLRGLARAGWSARRGAARRRRSTASRSSFGRERSRCASGPEWTRRSTSCARRARPESSALLIFG